MNFNIAFQFVGLWPIKWHMSDPMYFQWPQTTSGTQCVGLFSRIKIKCIGFKSYILSLSFICNTYAYWILGGKLYVYLKSKSNKNSNLSSFSQKEKIYIRNLKSNIFYLIQIEYWGDKINFKSSRTELIFKKNIKDLYISYML